MPSLPHPAKGRQGGVWSGTVSAAPAEIRRALTPMRFLAILLAALALPLAAQADPPQPTPDERGHSVSSPTPMAELRALCTDRPTKSTGPCTVDAGHWQVESDIYNVSV